MNEAVIIRPMTRGDYPEVYRLWKSADGVGMRRVDDSEAGIGKFLGRNPETCFVAEGAGGAAPELRGVILSGHDGRRGYIYHALVREGDRGCGIGGALVEAVEKAMKAEGINKIALVAFRTNNGGNRFWEKQGYTERTDLCYRNKSLNPENV